MKPLVALVGIAALLAATPRSAAHPARGCTGAAAQALVVRFLDAFNRGDLRAIDRTIAGPSYFKWYSVSNEPGRRVRSAAYSRRSLIPYFRERHAHHEVLLLRSFRFGGRSSGYGHFQYRLGRWADELPAGTFQPYLGKGAVDCSVGKIAVWSMGLES